MSDMKVIVSEVDTKRGLLSERYTIQIEAISPRMPDPLHLRSDNPETGERALTDVSSAAIPKHVRDALYLWLASVEVTA
ncbi:hypothetical protein ASG84_13925 [Rhodococcus sp. Leaf278]|uniref:hypothetical protein n=1 Tax=Rhodococcus sp. Leaf278 TaxID=1736319 RepID=UPI00070EB55C|nr:hypothetical protein [Rhodococcus sp. Leaf278]KQU44364.1 hypothetical protein ASG84_13925 [Rhodococcus sp. Leaf278]